jgi:hypothetical protein
MKKFDGVVPGQDEEWLSCIKPTELGIGNCFNGDAIVSHFSFFTQRWLLDKSSILEQYGSWLHAQWACDAEMREIDRTVQWAMVEVERRKTEILAGPDVYKRPPPRTPTVTYPPSATSATF